MALDFVDRLAECAAELKSAMEAGESDQVEAATSRFREALSAVQSVGAWQTDPILKERIRKLLPELEASRMLACLLGDLTGQMHSAIAAGTRETRQPLYGRAR